MLTKRIVPCLDVRGGKVVKGTKFKDIKEVDDPVVLAKFYNDNGADELVFYDITASHEGRKLMLDVVRRTANEVFIPFSVGGGVNSVDDFKQILRAGADKISINSSAVKNPRLITDAALKFGAQCVVLSIDAKKVDSTGKWNVFINGGRIDTGMDAIEWAKRGVELGAGEIVLNSIDADGVKQGYDIELTRTVSSLVSVPVIASGGAGKKEDFYEVLTEGMADAALAASVFHFKEIEIPNLKQYLYEKDIPVRREW
ncbi:imidazole glycerol phosphate synthase subunit hisF [Peptoclostridium litorale DSM 5388]|uniref:Imidazole glycerol phosphate synthase subunit HisF n=1 Tax=Peptoclostridium litorale DSM 5388 TaxID=1121324 RepID=A0A069RDM3_PEPLI|nr:imidazole glycerol phosphate synthase subunit HisF [Peptoclostridium litorale]KDR95106.1 imidazole glycerol phosphate synthase subunit HisF [Peptoclostridium litorale DSM 5388]SIN74914.1 imidazole glycerol phosphate synthase subunit hisF [Peptoclostridium litorale DSM 5388]